MMWFINLISFSFHLNRSLIICNKCHYSLVLLHRSKIFATISLTDFRFSVVFISLSMRILPQCLKLTVITSFLHHSYSSCLSLLRKERTREGWINEPINQYYIHPICRLDQGNLPQPYTLSVKEEVFAACFTSKENKILTSNGSGTINVSYIENSIFWYEFCELPYFLLTYFLYPEMYHNTSNMDTLYTFFLLKNWGTA